MLLVPKRRIRSLLELADPANADLYADILLVAHAVEQALGLASHDYVLCANGGPRQEVQQVHFHMFSGERYVSSPDGDPPQLLYEDDEIIGFNHPTPDWDVHVVIRLRPEVANGVYETASPLGRIATQLVSDLGLDRRGYTLVIQHDGGSYCRGLAFHVIGGYRRTAT